MIFFHLTKFFLFDGLMDFLMGGLNDDVSICCCWGEGRTEMHFKSNESEIFAESSPVKVNGNAWHAWHACPCHFLILNGLKKKRETSSISVQFSTIFELLSLVAKIHLEDHHSDKNHVKK